ncbi:UNVERIFIED_CONTAM: hypothetical protein GTU68_045840 [Idotea baltica]|nr:hypothetical protein [Idotea baltica]
MPCHHRGSITGFSGKSSIP